MPFDLEKIKVGDYVRTKKGNIGKFKFYGFDDVNKKIVYFKNSNGSTCVDETEIVKNSPNIIDLIEVDDYVNGHKIVREIWGEDDNDLHFEIEGGFGKATYIGEKNIKSIATKEQFKSVEYKIGGE